MQPGRTDTGDAGLGALLDFGFNRFITLSVIKILYILGLLLLVLIWLVFVIGSFTQGALEGLVALVVGSVGALLYAIFWRIWLELIVVVFRIGENTTKIAQGTGGVQGP